MNTLKSGLDKSHHSISLNKFSFLFLLLLSIVGLIFAGRYLLAPKTPKVVQKTIMKQVLVKRSKDLGLIDKSLTGKAIDVNTGRIVKTARVFTIDDRTVYLELDLLNAPKNTVIDYVRYKNGRYVDHGEVNLSKPDTKLVLFNWSISRLSTGIREGKWKVATYANGILAKRVLYEVNNNKISQYYEQPINSSDPDYRLNHVLSLGLSHEAHN